VNPTIVVSDTRRKPRRARVVREPIDLEQLAAEFAESSRAPEPQRSEAEIVAALQAEVERVKARETATDSDVLEPAAPQATVPQAAVPEVGEPDPVAPNVPRAPVGGREIGLPLDQVRAWFEQVKDDLRKVQARVEYLEFEQTKLQEQHRLVAELVTSTQPV
jgi:hypothetical protein